MPLQAPFVYYLRPDDFDFEDPDDLDFEDPDDLDSPCDEDLEELDPDLVEKEFPLLSEDCGTILLLVEVLTG
jgi:hypothetical protein